MEVGPGIWIASGLIILVIVWLTIWVTNKAYSRKWEEDE
mgnify:CR=1 FL=1